MIFLPPFDSKTVLLPWQLTSRLVKSTRRGPWSGGLTTLLLTTLTFCLQAQPAAPATVAGTLTNCADGEAVKVVRPVAGGYLNYFYTTAAPQVLLAAGRFQVRFPPQAGGELVSLQSKCLPQLYAFVEPGATVTLRQAAADAAGKPGDVVFEGTNAAGNNLLAAGRLFNCRGGVDGERVQNILLASPTANAALNSLRRELRRSTALLDSVRERRLISAACYARLRAEAEQYMLFWTGGLLSAYFNKESQNKLPIQFSEAGMKQLAQALYTELDPFQARYQKLGISLAVGFKCTLLERGVLTGPKQLPTARHWQRYAAQFQEINSNFGAYDFAPPAVQARLVGNELLTALVFRPMSNEQYATVFQDYVQHFPASSYVAVLTQALLREQPVGPAAGAASAAAVNPNQDLGHYDTATDQLTFAPVAGLDTVTTLAALVRRQFPGRAVFVDFWASWCGPCIAAFRYEPQTHEFLAKNGIEPLYVALNNANYRPKWRDFVVQNKLRGSHYLASAAMQTLLNKQFSGIPRYMLFDQNGQLVDDNLPGPETGAALRQRLTQKLGLK